ncbi:MAG: hypothetical protein J6866_03450 [Victivallales bacterium]|nr:hypothetical protein [Victivallales bacterium]
MPTATNNSRRQTVLLIVMLVIGLLLAKRYLGDWELPTSKHIEEKIQQLNSARNDLKIAQMGSEHRLEELLELQEMSSDFWRPSSQRGQVDQEIVREFGKLLRRAQLPANHKIDVQRNKLPGVNYLQEVQIKLDLKGVTMKEITRLLSEIRKNNRKLTWVHCQISPDNPRTPQNVNMNATLRAIVLTNEATEFLQTGHATAPSLANGAKKPEGGTRL